LLTGLNNFFNVGPLHNLEFVGKEIHNFMAVPASYGNRLKVSGIRKKEKGQRGKAKGKRVRVISLR